MANFRTIHSGIPMGPYKLRPVCDQVRGLSVRDALIVLKLTPRAAAQILAKKIQSSASAAIDKSLDPTKLIVSVIYADQLTELKRLRIRSRGRSATMRKRSTTVTIELAQDSAVRRVAPLNTPKSAKKTARASKAETVATEKGTSDGSEN